MINFSLSLRTRFVAALVVLGLVAGFAGFAGSAEASGPSPTPNGQVGACNMAVPAAMGNTSHQGFDGMVRAIVVSGGTCL
jgi:hypothetical protein